MPRRFFTATLRAAVQGTDYARTDKFVLPCVSSYGARRVTEELLPYLKSGTEAQRAGAAVALVSTAKAALDWQSYCYTGRVSERGSFAPSTEATERYAAWQGLREVRNQLLVDVFRANEDMMVRRRIVSLLYSDPEVPHDLRTALGPVGLAIARHDDMSVAQRRALLVIAMAEVGYRPTLFPLHTTLLSPPRQFAHVQRLFSIAVRRAPAKGNGCLIRAGIYYMDGHDNPLGGGGTRSDKRRGARSMQRYTLRALSLLALMLLWLGGSFAPRQPAVARPTAAGELGAGAQPDGNLWFTEDRGSAHGSAIGRISPSGAIREYPLPRKGDTLGDLAFDRTGDLWFTEPVPGAIGRLNRSGRIATYPIAWHPAVSTVAATPSVRPQFPSAPSRRPG